MFYKYGGFTIILQDNGTDRTLVFVEKKKDADFRAQFVCQLNQPATFMQRYGWKRTGNEGLLSKSWEDKVPHGRE